MVKCAECGFLSVVDHYTGDFCEADEKARTTGRYRNSQGKFAIANVRCYKGSPKFCPLDEDVWPHGQYYDVDPEPLVTLLNEEKDCGELFRKREPGKSPKEHDEMSILEQVEIRNAQQRIDDIARQQHWRDEFAQWRSEFAQWRNEINEQMDRTSEQTKRSFRQSRTHHNWNYILSGLAIIISLFGTLIAALLAARVIRIPWLEP
jgi:hypothetical protein